MARHPRPDDPEDRRSRHDLHERTALPNSPARPPRQHPADLREREKAQVRSHARVHPEFTEILGPSACRGAVGGPGARRGLSPRAVGRRRCRWRWSPAAARRACAAAPGRSSVGSPRATTWTAKSRVRERVPTRVSVHVTSRTSPARTGATELHVGVRREQPLVAVGADAHLGGHVAEQLEAVGAVDQVAGVVGVGVRHVAAVHDGGADFCPAPGRVTPRPSPGRAGGRGTRRPRRAWCRG